jgi:hypothetical protein
MSTPPKPTLYLSAARERGQVPVQEALCWRPLSGQAEAFDVAYWHFSDTAVTHFFALSPSSTRRRMASEGVSFRSDAHALTAAKTSGGTRAESNGLMPVVGRPGFFLSTDIAFFIVIVYKKASRGEASTSAPALTRTTLQSHETPAPNERNRQQPATHARRRRR